jgi:2,4-dienoyl-CoA reductase-like NADH-dependent reductase (Old Yellow Enzyme family)/thioredoxin reductase
LDISFIIRIEQLSKGVFVMSKFKSLFSPIQVGTHTYKNRIIAAPIYCGTFINIPGLDNILKYSMMNRANGGCAQVTFGETAVDFEGASREPFPPINYADLNDPALEKFKEIVDYIHSKGAFALIELSHCGESVEPIPGVEFGMGPMGYTREDGMKIYAMDEKMMQKVIDHFVQAAKFMKEAGFDGVMIHAGHGWLIHQFLSARTNRRTDEYGGSLENRARFPLALIKAVREAMGKDFIIEIRVSGDECEENGMGVEETAEFCKMAEPYVDIVHVSVGTYRNPIHSGEFSSMYHEHALNAKYSKVIKEKVNIPVAVVGGINSPELAEQLINEGKCDLVALARQLTADPFFAQKAENGREDDINPCIRCFKCFMGPLEGVDISEMPKLFGCTVNPAEFFYDFDFLSRQPEASRNVLVIGGGVAGMQAAVTAHDRGHKVTLVEKTDKLGGLLNFTDTDLYKTDLRIYKDVLVRRVKERNIKVLYNTEVTADNIASYNADAVVIAVGSSPVCPPIPGIENAHHALEVYRNPDFVGQKVVMIGGGLVGCETGLHLAKMSKDVTIIEMLDKVAPDSYPMHRVALVAEMDKMLKYHCGLKCVAIEPNKVVAEASDGTRKEFEADTVIYALGMKANNDLAKSLEAAAKVKTYVVGDCTCAAKVYDANRAAFIAGMDIL